MVQLLAYLLLPLTRYAMVLVVCVLSVVNMLIFRVRGICLSSILGEYLSLVIVIGMMARVYIAGISQNNQDYTFADGDKAIYTLIANVLIILGLTILCRNVTQYAISAILVADQIRRAAKVTHGLRMPSGGARPWNVVIGLTREWTVIVLVSVLGMLIDYITFRNGGAVPLKL